MGMLTKDQGLRGELATFVPLSWSHKTFLPATVVAENCN